MLANDSQVRVILKIARATSAICRHNLISIMVATRSFSEDCVNE